MTKAKKEQIQERMNALANLLAVAGVMAKNIEDDIKSDKNGTREKVSVIKDKIYLVMQDVFKAVYEA